MTHHNTYGSLGNYPTLAKSGRTWGTVEFKTWRDTRTSSLARANVRHQACAKGKHIESRENRTGAGGDR